MGGKSSRRVKGCACVQTRQRTPVPHDKHVDVHSVSSAENKKAKQKQSSGRQSSLASTGSGHPTFSLTTVANVVEENKEEEPAGCRALTDTDKFLLKNSWKHLRKSGTAIVEDLVSTYLHGFIHLDISKEAFPGLYTSRINPLPLMEEASGNVHVHHTLNTIDMAIDHLDSLYSIAQPLRKMGARHVGYNVYSHEYIQCYTLALFHALKVIQNFDSHSDVAHAWTVLLSFIRRQMTIGVHQMTRSRSELRSPTCGKQHPGTSTPDKSGSSRMSSISSSGYISPYSTLFEPVSKQQQIRRTLQQHSRHQPVTGYNK
ncbi:uncharacterized protein [Littorina saxatilis]|uniref:uncharacterized protein n=1 Tax=Littorina saxatilis TaxID=31220 RepID=UPI0038B5FA77